MNYLVEIKKEYTITLVNIITPSIYQGIESIFKESEKLGTKDETLKIFQGLLRRVPKWNLDMIDTEANRILSNSRCSEWLYDLVKAVIKSNITLLTNSCFRKKKRNTPLIDPSLYENISFSDFIHKVYIECAREIWNNPYLFSSDYNPIDIKRNQRDALYLIKDAIKEAIRKMLPVRHILKEYLGNNIIENNTDFESSVNEAQSQNIKSLLKKDLENNIIEENIRNQALSPVLSHINYDYDNKKMTPSKPLVPTNNIINTEKYSDLTNIMKPTTSLHLSSTSPLKKDTNIERKTVNKDDIINILKDTHISENNINQAGGRKSSYDATSENITTRKDKNIFEKKIQNILRNDLNNNNSEDSDTSISYTHANNNESFEDVFSNVNGSRKSNIDITSIASEIFINNLLDDNNKNKKNIKKDNFSNYLKN
jgi:hypothetical protein